MRRRELASGSVAEPLLLQLSAGPSDATRGCARHALGGKAATRVFGLEESVWSGSPWRSPRGLSLSRSVPSPLWSILARARRLTDTQIRVEPPWSLAAFRVNASQAKMRDDYFVSRVAEAASRTRASASPSPIGGGIRLRGGRVRHSSL